MDSKEFIKTCLKGGYVPYFKEKYLKKWVAENPKDEYTNDDLINAWRIFDSDIHTDGEWGKVYDVYK